MDCRVLPATALLLLQLAAALDGAPVTDDNEHAADYLVDEGLVDWVGEDFIFPTHEGFEVLS